MITTYQSEFAKGEFKHPDQVNQEAYDFLVKVRRRYAKPMVLTDDARVPTDKPLGFSETSLHYKGQAFDLRARDMSWVDMWNLVEAIMFEAFLLPKEKQGVELELVWSETDKHVHIAIWLDGKHKNTLELRLE